jgi:hypothetical protein
MPKTDPEKIISDPQSCERYCNILYLSTLQTNSYSAISVVLTRLKVEHQAELEGNGDIGILGSHQHQLDTW